jgi:hypothetical protein
VTFHLGAPSTIRTALCHLLVRHQIGQVIRPVIHDIQLSIDFNKLEAPRIWSEQVARASLETVRVLASAAVVHADRASRLVFDCPSELLCATAMNCSCMRGLGHC